MFVITISGCTTIIQVRLTADLVNTVNRIRIMKLSMKNSRIIANDIVIL